MARDPGGEVHRAPVDVAVADDQPAGGHAGVRRGEPAGRDLVDQPEDRRDRLRRRSEPQQDPVAEELDDAPTRGPCGRIGHLGEARRRRGRDVIALLDRQAGEPGQVHEGDRRRRLGPGRDPAAADQGRLVGVDDPLVEDHLELALVQPRDQRVEHDRALERRVLLRIGRVEVGVRQPVARRALALERRVGRVVPGVEPALHQPAARLAREAGHAEVRVTLGVDQLPDLDERTDDGLLVDAEMSIGRRLDEAERRVDRRQARRRPDPAPPGARRTSSTSEARAAGTGARSHRDRHVPRARPRPGRPVRCRPGAGRSRR